MAFTPSAGLNCILANDAAGAQPLAGMNWTIDVDPRPKDVSNFVTGREKVPTLLDATLTFQLVWDLANAPVSGAPATSYPGNYWAGNYVTVYAFVDKAGGKYFKFVGLISKVTPSIASIEDAMLYNVEVSLSQSVPTAGNPFSLTSLGSLTYPT